MDPSHSSFPPQSGHGGSVDGWGLHSAAGEYDWSSMFPNAANQWSYGGNAANIPQYATPVQPSGLATHDGSIGTPTDTSEYQAFLNRECVEDTLPHGSFQDFHQGASPQQQNQPDPLLPHQVYYPQPAQHPTIHSTPQSTHGFPTLSSHYPPSPAVAHGSAHPGEHRDHPHDAARYRVILLRIQCRIALEKYTRSLELLNEDAQNLIKTNMQYMEAIRAAFEHGYGLDRDGNLSM